MKPRPSRALRSCLVLCLVSIVLAPNARASGVTEGQRTWYAVNKFSKGSRVLTRMPDPLEFSEFRMRRGDDPRWSRPDYDDSDWEIIAQGRTPQPSLHEGIRWMRFRVRWNSPDGSLPPGIHLLFMLAAYDVYWDGALIASNGRPADTTANEVEGVTQTHASLPPAATGTGEHLVALRLSTWHAGGGQKSTYLVAIFMSAADFDALFRMDNVLPVMAAGALLTMTIASLVMWLFAARRRVLILFAGSCFFGGLMQAVYWYQLAYVYPVSWQNILQETASGAALLLGLCVAAIATEEWKIPHRLWWLGALLPADAAIVCWRYPDIVHSAVWFIGASFVFVLTAGAWAATRKRPNVWALTAPVSLSGILLWQDPFHFVGFEFFQRFLPTTLGLIVTIALRLRAERRKVQEMKLTAARLEIELLKKNLQPHFLMNTLTALAQTVEEAPGNAVQLIDDLAMEFRTLARMAGERTVTLEQELELCRAHLRVMKARTDLPWTLDSDGVDMSSVVPPALFLTLIENGFSHQRARKGENLFTLRGSKDNRATRYVFRSPGEVTDETNRASGGTGLRYVRARLEESFPGAWKLTQGEVEGAWQTEIVIRPEHGAGVPA